MSIRALEIVLRAKGIKGRKKMVLVGLASHADDNGASCFPKIKTLADEIGLSEYTVQRALHDVVGDKLVTRSPRYLPNGGRTTDDYRLDLEAISARHPPQQDAGDPPQQNGGDPPQQDAGDNELSVEWSEEPSGKSSGESKQHTVAGATGSVAPDADIIITEAVDPIEAEFERFWLLYPNKVGKPSALKAYKKARKKVGADTILSGLETYKRTKEDWQHWKGPAAWLNDERWNHEPAASPARRTGDEQIARAFADAIVIERDRASETVGGMQ